MENHEHCSLKLSQSCNSVKEESDVENNHTKTQKTADNTNLNNENENAASITNINENEKAASITNISNENEETANNINVNNETEKECLKNQDTTSNKSSEFVSVVAAHYNSLGSINLEERNASRIYYLRNFNNWIKAMLIKECISKLPENRKRNLKVLDMCCGRGGDLRKWLRSDLRYLICADIAEKSLEECEFRFKEFSKKLSKEKKSDCEFISADCTKVRLRGKYQDPSIELDVVSCQFSFHYCFESLPQAECMLKNASECLRPGGLFIGTIPNANEIVKRVRQSEKNGFKNDVFSVEMCCSEPYPLFGAKYEFFLEGVVNCPEFLVHFPTFEKLAMKFNLKLILRQSFPEFFYMKKREGQTLLRVMKGLETYPPLNNAKLVGPEKDYVYSKVYCEDHKVQHVGTISRSEWEAISLYQVFIFQKIKKQD